MHIIKFHFWKLLKNALTFLLNIENGGLECLAFMLSAYFVFDIASKRKSCSIVKGWWVDQSHRKLLIPLHNGPRRHRENMQTPSRKAGFKSSYGSNHSAVLKKYMKRKSKKQVSQKKMGPRSTLFHFYNRTVKMSVKSLGTGTYR